MTRLAAQQLPASRLREVLRGGGLDELPDAELLQRFARYGEHPAFDVLLRRHGPMVLGVCRRVLINSADVDDAFQATFLVFVRKAQITPTRRAARAVALRRRGPRVAQGAEPQSAAGRAPDRGHRHDPRHLFADRRAGLATSA